MVQIFSPWSLSALSFCVLILQTRAFLSPLLLLGGTGSAMFRPVGDHPQPTPKEVFLPRCEVSYLQSDYLLGEAPEVRPSLHPTTINALSECLKARALNDGTHKLRISEVTPLEVALAAGSIASNAIENRQKLSATDNMILYPEEEQTIAGRVVGVMMRIDALEEELLRRVTRVDWVRHSDLLPTFGLLPYDNSGVEQRIMEDPLFAMNRAECLLAMFILAVEIPTLKRINQKVPDGSKIDFLDDDRYKVLLENYDSVVMR